MTQPSISIISVMSVHTHAIGKDNKLLWHIPKDLKRFKQLTNGKTVIMGRKTFESILFILGTPLPNRTNIVLTRQSQYIHESIITVQSFHDALNHAFAKHTNEICIIGGETVYKQALLYADTLYLTLVDSHKKGDAFFPQYKHIFTHSSDITHNTTDTGLSYTFVTYKKH